MNYILHIIAMTAIVLPAILGYNLVLGKGKILHFGPIGVGIVTAYAVVIPLMKWGSWPLAIGIGLVVGAIISLLFTWLALRLDGDGFGILSIAMHLSIFAVVLNWSDLTRGALGITMIPRMPFLGDLGSFALASTIVSAL